MAGKTDGKADIEDIVISDDRECLELIVDQEGYENLTFLDKDLHDEAWKGKVKHPLQHNGATELNLEELTNLVIYQLERRAAKRISICIFQKAAITHSFDEIKKVLNKISNAYYKNKQHMIVFGSVYYPPDHVDKWLKITEINELIRNHNMRFEKVQLSIHNAFLKYCNNENKVDFSCFEKTHSGYDLNQKGFMQLYAMIDYYHRLKFGEKYDFNRPEKPYQTPKLIDLQAHEDLRSKHGNSHSTATSKKIRDVTKDLRQKLDDKNSSTEKTSHEPDLRVKLTEKTTTINKRKDLNDTSSEKCGGKRSKPDEMDKSKMLPEKQKTATDLSRTGDYENICKESFTVEQVAGRMAALDILEEQLQNKQSELKIKEQSLIQKENFLNAKILEVSNKENILKEREQALIDAEREVEQQRLDIRIEK